MQRRQEELFLDTKGQETEVQEENKELEFNNATTLRIKFEAITTLKNYSNNHAGNNGNNHANE